MDVTRKLKKSLKNVPNLLSGYNIYVSPEKLQLIDYAFRNLQPAPKSFADLGGVWKVNAAYTRYSLKSHSPERGFLVDTNYNEISEKKLTPFSNLKCLQGNFGSEQICDQIRQVDMIYLFDVLLHQVKPDWDAVLARYAKICNHFAIYNQQLISGDETVRLTSMPLDEYRKYAPQKKDGMYEFIFEHADDWNDEYQRRWIDVHNIWQWGIPDKALRAVMEKLGFREVYYKNYGRFSNLAHFEDHGFIFSRI